MLRIVCQTAPCRPPGRNGQSRAGARAALQWPRWGRV